MHNFSVLLKTYQFKLQSQKKMKIFLNKFMNSHNVKLIFISVKCLLKQVTKNTYCELQIVQMFVLFVLIHVFMQSSWAYLNSPVLSFF